MKKTIFLILALIFIITGCEKDEIVPGEKGNITNIENNKIKEVVESDKILDKLNKMTLEEKIGQLIIVGIEGTTINQKELNYINELKVGGFILFKRNIVNEFQTMELLNRLKEENIESNNIPLFLSIDEEGGRVSRFSKGFEKLPTASKIGNKNNEKLAYDLGAILAERLKTMGFNMNFAPVMDINSNPKNPVIGDRSFGNTAEIVSFMGINVMKAMQENHVIPSIKHFPGHGDTDVDSHIKLPVVYKTLDELKKLELVPFKNAIENQADTVMVAHILYPEIDKENPASLSNEIINNILRKDLNFNGVVISDDMTMGAVISNYTLEEAVVKFLKAGGDLALVCHGVDNPHKVIKKIKESLDTGTITMEELDEKVYRLLSLKEKYKLEDKSIENIDLKHINEKTKIFKDLLNK